MFRHQGKTRTLSHNLRIASLLSFVAGIVNVAGFLSVHRLTTNVTGHFAFFVEEALGLRLEAAFIFLVYIFAFFFGSFLSNLLVEVTSRKSERYMFFAPIILEITVITFVGLFGLQLALKHPNLIACSLLFAMGLQNSLVTTISNSIVRTTHLTGLFTDLGIELSQLFFYKTAAQKFKLQSSMKLRFTIIFFFFIGGVVGGGLFAGIQLQVLFIAAGFLTAGLVYDNLKFRLLLLHRKLTKGFGQ